MESVRRVIGKSTAGPGDVAQLAVLVAQEARTLGLKVVSLKCSHSRAWSLSRYIELDDRLGQRWMVRVSNHYRPRNSSYAPPHFDLVSLDGSSGLNEARKYLRDVATGKACWFDRTDIGRRPRHRRRQNPKRFMR